MIECFWEVLNGQKQEACVHWATKQLVCLEGRRVGMGEIWGYCIQDKYNDDLDQGVTVEVGRSGQIRDDLVYWIDRPWWQIICDTSREEWGDNNNSGILAELSGEVEEPSFNSILEEKKNEQWEAAWEQQMHH